MVLDIGPGSGKYAKIVRDVAAKDQFETHLTAVEIDGSYVEKFNLKSLYDDVIIDSAINLIEKPRVRFGLVIIGDCIEHMRKSDGLDLINFLIYRSGYIFVVYPEAFIQDDWEGHAAEAHISTWAIEDFATWKPLHHNRRNMHLVVIKGYQPSRMRITG